MHIFQRAVCLVLLANSGIRRPCSISCQYLDGLSSGQNRGPESLLMTENRMTFSCVWREYRYFLVALFITVVGLFSKHSDGLAWPMVWWAPSTRVVGVAVSGQDKYSYSDHQSLVLFCFMAARHGRPAEATRAFG